MIPSETPWSGLEAGRIDTRRVDAMGRWNFFWAVMPRADVALVLQLKELPYPTPDLPKLRNLEIRFQTLPGGPIFYIRLKDNAQIEIFETLCRDVIVSAETAANEHEALERAIGRTFRWHYLLRGGREGVLSEEAQKGLIGELEVLKLIMARVGPKSALVSWTGPAGSPKDFELKTGCIEVKARRASSQPYVKISSEHQLSDVIDRQLWLAIIAVDRVQQPHGQTLTECVADLAAYIQASEPAAMLDLELHLADVGYDNLHSYDAWRWIVSKPEFHEVKDGFPRISAPVPLGVSNVTYSLALSGCAPFRVDWSLVSKSLFKEGSDERA